MIEEYPKTHLTDAQLRASPVPVSGPLTDAQLRATAVPVSGPLTDAQLRATPVPISGALTDAELRATPVEVTPVFDYLKTLDAAGRLRVSQAVTLFDSQTEYGLDTIFSWDCTANGTLSGLRSPNGSVSSGGNAVGPRDVNTRLTPITCSATNGHYAILQSRTYWRYTPGFGQYILVTGVFSTNNTHTASIVLRSSTSGTPSDVRSVAQADWNIDTFGAAALNPSGVTIDFTTTQILFISGQWLGVDGVVVGFKIGDQFLPAHVFMNANVLAVPYSQTFNLPIRLEARTSGASTLARAGYFDAANGVFLETTNDTAGGTMYFNCASVQTEGQTVPRGIPRSQVPSVSSVAVTTRRPIISIRPAELYQGLTNRSHIDLKDIWITASTNGSIYEIVAGGILGGASWQGVGTSVTAGSFVVGIRYKITSIGTTDFTLIGAAANTVGLSFVASGVGVGTGTAVPEYSCVEWDSAATTITSGIVIATGEVIAGSGVTRGAANTQLDFRARLTLSKIDSLTASQLPISIVCTSVTGTSNIRAGINWHEQNI